MSKLTAEHCLTTIFNYPKFRPDQKKIIDAIVNDKRDVCAIMATGSGKSICFQIPPLITNKPAIIISPLLSLMEDQQAILSKLNIACCCYNSASNKLRENAKILNNDYKLIYITPEMIITETAQSLLETLNKKIGISLIAIDEAHCVSLWGNTFRSSYLKLGDLKETFPDVPLLALTGTATNKVVDDMVTLLNMEDPLVIKASMNRPNLSYYVFKKTNIENDLISVSNKEFTIIYCQSRKDTESITLSLKNKGIKVNAYHAGLTPSIRTSIQSQFMEGKIMCIVATVAFGMGINKNNVRKIIHYGCPKDIESYIQETGRCGRDGEDGECYVYYSQKDFYINRYFLKDITDPVLKKFKEQSIFSIEKYLYINTCRRKYILDYFDEKSSGSINKKCCDVCDNKSDTNNVTMVNIGLFVQNYLSLVNMFPKFGKVMYINVLKGSKAKKMLDKFKNSKYYGIDNGAVDKLKLYVQYISNEGFFSENQISYGTTISLSQLGKDWLENNANTPTFLIPSGVVVDDKKEKKTINKVIKPVSSSDIKEISSTIKTTHNLLKDNKNVEDIIKIRKLTRSTIESHLVEIVKNGLDVDFKLLDMNETIYNAVLSAINVLKGDVTRLTPIKELCPKDITFFNVKIGIAIYVSKRNGELYQNNEETNENDISEVEEMSEVEEEDDEENKLSKEIAKLQEQLKSKLLLRSNKKVINK